MMYLSHIYVFISKCIYLISLYIYIYVCISASFHPPIDGPDPASHENMAAVNCGHSFRHSSRGLLIHIAVPCTAAVALVTPWGGTICPAPPHYVTQTTAAGPAIQL